MIYDDFLDDRALATYAQQINQRARRQNAPGSLDAHELRDCILQSGGRCGWCHADLVGQAFEIDHILAVSNGGANTRHNLVLSCVDCNRAKASQHPAHYAQAVTLRTGIVTPLIARLQRDYDFTAYHQRTLFNDPDEGLTSIDDDAPPPYRWGRR